MQGYILCKILWGFAPPAATLYAGEKNLKGGGVYHRNSQYIPLFGRLNKNDFKTEVSNLTRPGPAYWELMKSYFYFFFAEQSIWSGQNLMDIPCLLGSLSRYIKPSHVPEHDDVKVILINSLGMDRISGSFYPAWLDIK